ncbi:MAG: dephospho-CoA kinase [Oscillospiraceae bacterium]|jgi:dephospho-CoA kinase|nr:dephospho-CoA kinase [Oscillospiraceae bacterium]
MIIGLTGNSGAGKTCAARIISGSVVSGGLAAAVIDCDGVAKDVTGIGSDCVHEIHAKMPRLRGAISDKFSLNRAKIAEIVFADIALKQKYERIVFKYVTATIIKRIAELQPENEYIVLDAPTLFEANADKLCDIILAVTAPSKTLITRIVARDSLTPEQAALRLSAQKTAEYFSAKSDYVILNDGEQKIFERKVIDFCKQVPTYKTGTSPQTDTA